MLNKKQVTRFEQHDVAGFYTCQCCGKRLTEKDTSGVAFYRHFVITCRKHRKYCTKISWQIFRLPRKLKKKFCKKYPGMNFQKGIIQTFCNYKNTKTWVRIYRDNQGILGKIIEDNF